MPKNFCTNYQKPSQESSSACSSATPVSWCDVFFSVALIMGVDQTNSSNWRQVTLALFSFTLIKRYTSSKGEQKEIFPQNNTCPSWPLCGWLLISRLWLDCLMLVVRSEYTKALAMAMWIQWNSDEILQPNVVIHTAPSQDHILDQYPATFPCHWWCGPTFHRPQSTSWPHPPCSFLWLVHSTTYNKAI